MKSTMAWNRTQLLRCLAAMLLLNSSFAVGQFEPAGEIRLFDQPSNYVDRGFLASEFRDDSETANASSVTQAAWTDQIESYSPDDTRTGFLGKKILRGDYWTVGVDDQNLKSLDDTMNGYRVSFNYPLPWFTRDCMGLDVVAEYESLRFSGADSRGKLDIDFDFFTLGVRAYGEVFGCVRPFATLGAQEMRFEGASYRPSGALLGRSKYDEWHFYSALGMEIDLSETVGLRFEAELPEEIDDGFFESTMLFWSQDKSFFCRGGLQVPFEDDLGVGIVAGAGVSF